MTLNLLKGGHAPGYLRDEFVASLEDHCDRHTRASADTAKLRELTGKLWNCTDQMASADVTLALCFVESRTGADPDQLRLYSYSQAARAIRNAIDVGAVDA